MGETPSFCGDHHPHCPYGAQKYCMLQIEITDEPLSRLDVVSRNRKTLVSMIQTQDIAAEHVT